MAASTFQLSTTAQAMAGGVSSTNGNGAEYTFTVGGTFLTGDQITLQFTDSLTGFLTQVGAGNVTDVLPNYVFTFDNKEYVLANATAYFSAVGLPITFNDPNAAGNSFITMSNYYSTNEDVLAIAPYQGRLIFAFRRLVQIWTVDPDPANYAITQTLANIGTFAPASVQPVGDMDVYMLYDSGVRSVRVRDASNNAIIADVGTPIDAILQPVLASLTDTQKAASCAIVEPTSNRYWLFIPNSADHDNGVGKIYVFSYFPSSQIAAWSTYSPTYQAAISSPAANYSNGVVTYTGLTVGKRYAWTPGANEVSITNGSTTLLTASTTGSGGIGSFVATSTTAMVNGISLSASFTGSLTVTTAFTPQKFLVYNGQIFIRDTNNNFYQYGGASTNAYDNSGLQFTTPYLNADTPGTRKMLGAMDSAFEGTWAVNFSSDYITNLYKNIYNNTQSSFQFGRIQINRHATHFSFQGVENGNGYALFSNAIVYYTTEDQKNQP